MREWLEKQEGREWTREQTEYVLEHIRKVEATWQKIVDANRPAQMELHGQYPD